MPSNRSDSSNGRGRVIITPKHKHQISCSVFFWFKFLWDILQVSILQLNSLSNRKKYSTYEVLQFIFLHMSIVTNETEEVHVD